MYPNQETNPGAQEAFEKEVLDKNEVEEKANAKEKLEKAEAQKVADNAILEALGYEKVE